MGIVSPTLLRKNQNKAKPSRRV